MQGIPLSLLVPWPENQLGPVPAADLLDQILVADLVAYKQSSRYHVSGKLIYYQEDGILLGIPGIDDFGIVLRELAEVEVSFSLEGFSFRLQLGAFSVRLPEAIFRKIQVEDGHPKSDERGEWVLEDGAVELDVAWTLGTDGLREHFIVLEIDQEGNFKFQSFIDGEMLPLPSASMPFALINNTGVVISAKNLHVKVGINNSSFSADLINISLPDRSFGNFVPPDLQFIDVRIDKYGFTGTVSTLWPLEYNKNKGFFYDIDNYPSADLFGLNGGIRNFRLAIKQNAIVESNISGGLVIPYFDEPLDIRINIQADGSFSVTFLDLNADGVTLSKEELLALTIQSLTVQYDKQKDLALVAISGGLQPLLMSSDGLEWPRLDVTDLSIEQDITDLSRPPIIKFKEAWLDLTEIKPLDLWGFKFELSRVGLGFEDARDRLWVDLSGSVRLLPQIPVGLDVEGFRMSWPRDINAYIANTTGLELAQKIGEVIEVKFDGVQLFYGIPQTVEFEGFIRFIKEAQKVGFAGDMILRVPSVGFSAEAGLMIGMNFETPPYPFLYVYLGVELPNGIPLGQSGLALKGVLGLFGLNVYPDKTPEQNWYYDWYKRGPIVGAHPTNKWRDERNALALGIGVTITTADGYIKGTRGLLVLAVPGPILVIEGRALILDGLQPAPAEPPLRALAIFDGGQGTVQFNIEAEAELVEDMLMAYATLEAFFDFKDLTNWHLYLGQDQPESRRIRASIFKFQDRFLFDANAYLMMDMVGQETLRSRMGVFVGFEPEIPSFDPVTVTLSGIVDGHGLITRSPEQFSGELNLEADLTITAFDFFRIRFEMDATLFSESPDPFKVEAELHVTVELPKPLDPFEEKLHFEWVSPTVPEIQPPLIGSVADSNFVTGGGELALIDQYVLDKEDTNRQKAAEASPVVPLDARPTLAFGHDMADGSNGGFRRDPDGRSKPYFVGPMQFNPVLKIIRLYEHRKDSDWDDNDQKVWTLIHSTVASETGDDIERLWGTWLADTAPEDPSAPAVRRLRLWTDDPFVHAKSELGSSYPMFFGLPGSRQHFSDTFLKAYPDYHKCRDTEPRQVCIDFKRCTIKQREQKYVLSCDGFTLETNSVLEIKQAGTAGSVRPPNNLQLDEIYKRIVQLDARFKDPKKRTLTELRNWANSITAEQQKRIRRQHADLNYLWRWLWPPTITRTTLVLNGDYHRIHIKFPVLVHQARFQFVLTPGQDVLRQARVLRPAQTMEEAEKLTAEAQDRGMQPDFTACAFPVTYTSEVDGNSWSINADEGFQCLVFDDLSISKLLVEIDDICYVTVEEKERAARARQQCKTNDEPSPMVLLRPGSYYRLVIETSLRASLSVYDTIQNIFYKDIINRLSDFESIDNGNLIRRQRKFVQESFFQTEGPPTNLSRYVKWSTPLPHATRVFRSDGFAIRFLRSNIKKMYSEKAHQLKIYLRDAQGRVFNTYITQWNKAGSSTLLPEEQVWLNHRRDDNDPEPTIDKDDLLVARLGNHTQPLEGKARYDLLVTGGEGGALLFKDDFVDSLLESSWQSTEDWVVSKEKEGLKPPLNGGTILTRDEKWRDVDFSVEIKSEEGTSFGVIFCYQRDQKGGESYYRFLMETEGVKLQRIDSSGTPILFQKNIKFSLSRWLRLRVSVFANQVRIWLFHTQILTVDFQDGGAVLQQGSIGFYSSSNHARFRRFYIREAVLYRVPFTTSAFESFNHLVCSFTDQDCSNARPVLSLDANEGDAAAITDYPNTSKELALQLLNWERAQVDYRDEMINREDFENHKLMLREAKANHDEHFRSICDSIVEGMYYQPFSSKLEVYSLKLPDGNFSGFWIRSPESLDLQLPVNGNHVGRTTLKLERIEDSRHSRTEKTTNLLCQILHDSDSTQILLLIEKRQLIKYSFKYRLTLTYLRDHGDESNDEDHRYDRPIEMARDNDSPQAIVWYIKR